MCKRQSPLPFFPTTDADNTEDLDEPPNENFLIFIDLVLSDFVLEINDVVNIPTTDL